MKKPANRLRRRGFTLVELLVVIAIIAVLAAASFAAVNGALKRARMTKGTVAATSLATAIEQYYGEYNKLPSVGGGGQIRTDSPELLEILLAEDGTTEDNPRKIVFLNVSEGKNKNKGGLVYNGDQIEGLYDPFGNPFTVILNDDYEDSITVTGYPGNPRLRNQQAAVYSPGPDGDPQTADDNIVSWPD